MATASPLDRFYCKVALKSFFLTCPLVLIDAFQCTSCRLCCIQYFVLWLLMLMFRDLRFELMFDELLMRAFDVAKCVRTPGAINNAWGQSLHPWNL